MLKNFRKTSYVTKFKCTNFYYYEIISFKKSFRPRVLLLVSSSAIPSRVITTECCMERSMELYEPEDISLSFLISSRLPLKLTCKGSLSPPCGRSEEYLLPPITTQSIVPFSNKKKEKFCDSCPCTGNDIRPLKPLSHIYHWNSMAPFHKRSVHQLLHSICFDRYGNNEYNCLARNSPAF